MIENVHIRDAHPADAEEILDMQRSLALYLNHSADEVRITAEQVEETIRNRERNLEFMRVADMGHAGLAGMIYGKETAMGWNGLRGEYVEDFFVRFPYRSIGVGAQLLASVAWRSTELAGDDASQAFVRLATPALHNQDTRDYYEKNGMSAENVEYRTNPGAVQDLLEKANRYDSRLYASESTVSRS
ncbi:hypothetical protein EON76_02895 [bacterium]|nr:MAG: hypothetical protein EON76_02895 [bacterium]